MSSIWSPQNPSATSHYIHRSPAKSDEANSTLYRFPLQTLIITTPNELGGTPCTAVEPATTRIYKPHTEYYEQYPEEALKMLSSLSSKATSKPLWPHDLLRRASRRPLIGAKSLRTSLQPGQSSSGTGGQSGSGTGNAKAQECKRS